VIASNDTSSVYYNCPEKTKGVACLLDLSLIVGNMEQTTSILAESTNLSYKTTKTVLQKLEKIGFVAPTRKIGNAQTYKFQVENHMRGLLACGAEFQRNRTDI